MDCPLTEIQAHSTFLFTGIPVLKKKLIISQVLAHKYENILKY